LVALLPLFVVSSTAFPSSRSAFYSCTLPLQNTFFKSTFFLAVHSRLSPESPLLLGYIVHHSFSSYPSSATQEKNAPMARQGPRLHRLPHRLDYTLIPAPLDLSLPLATEKSPLPAIIVTPSSPSSSHDFSIAFLATPPKPTLKERVSSYVALKPSFPVKARTTMIIFLIIFVLVCHVVTHRLAARRPHLEFAVQGGEAHLVDSTFGTWFDFRSLTTGTVPDGKPEFIITEFPNP